MNSNDDLDVEMALRVLRKLFQNCLKTTRSVEIAARTYVHTPTSSNMNAFVHPCLGICYLSVQTLAVANVQKKVGYFHVTSNSLLINHS